MMLVACDKILRSNIHSEKFFAALMIPIRTIDESKKDSD